MRVALVHDFLTQFGGAERVLASIHEIWPQAPLYTSIFDPFLFSALSESSGWDVYSSFLQSFPPARWFTKYFTFLVPLIFEQFDLSDFDVVISSSANFAKGVITQPHQLHICYCHTPPRFLYHYTAETDKRQNRFLGPLLRPLDSYLRIWDFQAAQRVNFFVANSENTRQRIKKFYRREAEVIYPPVGIQMYPNKDSPNKSKSIRIKDSDYSDSDKLGYFLVVSRLSAYKRVDLAVKACTKLGLLLKVIGIGPEKGKLMKVSGPTIEFLGFVKDEDLVSYYRDCRAVIFPVEDEEFGIVPVEAMSLGKPIIALRRGGVTETIIEGKTGLFFEQPTVESLIDALHRFETKRFSSQDCIRQAANFSKDRFQKSFKAFVEKKWKEFKE